MLSLLALNAHAYVLRTAEDGSSMRWETFPVEWSYAPQAGDPEGTEDAVQAAFDAWEAIGTAIAFERVDGGDNVVFFDREGAFDPDVLASTASWATDDGELVAFDVRVNPAVPWSTDGAEDAFDLEAAVTHEIGHALGLDHSRDADACMYEVQLPGDPRELGPDDVAAARALYPLEPGVGCSTAPEPTLAGLLGLLGVFRGCRRPRRHATTVAPPKREPCRRDAGTHGTPTAAAPR